jgi:E3 ubiquitin-protein ligase BRE1
MKTCVAQALKTSAENRHLTISLERTALDISNTEKEINALFAWLINHQPI